MSFGVMSKAALAAACWLSTACATAAPVINVELYNVYAPNNVVTNQTYIANHTADQRFQLTSLPSISGNSSNSPINLFGAALVAGSVETLGTADPSFASTLYRFSGFLDLGTAAQLFQIIANDGFQLSIAGTVILTSDTQGTKSTTTTVADGPQAFELIYWNNADFGQLNLTINGQGLQPVDGPLTTPQLPLPGSLPLVLAGFGGWAVWGRRRKAA